MLFRVAGTRHLQREPQTESKQESQAGMHGTSPRVRDNPPAEVAFLFTDIEGSTRLWEERTPEMRLALARHDALIRSTVERHSGRVFKSVGDGFHAVFSTAVEAVRAACEAQESLLKDVPLLKVRMAVHCGWAEARDEDYFGPTLNRVARMLSAAHGGQTLVSNEAATAIQDDLPAGADLRLLGPHRLRDIPSKEPLFQIHTGTLRSSFPALNTVDVAFRRGVARAARVALVVVSIVTGLAVYAFWQRREAERNLYFADLNLAQSAFEEGSLGRVKAALEETATYPGRGFEWGYWNRLIRQELRTLAGHEGGVYGVCFSKDGKRVFTAGRDRTVRAWETATGNPLFQLPVQRVGAVSVCVSPDGRLLITGDGGGTIGIWDSQTGGLIRPLTGHTKPVYSVQVSQDGRRLLSTAEDQTIRVWDLSGAEATRVIPTGRSNAVSASFSPDGRKIAAGYGTVIRIWDALTGKKLRELPGHSGWIWSVSFSPDGQRLVVAGEGRVVHVLDVNSFRKPLELKGHLGAVSCAAFSPDGRHLVTGSRDSTARTWNAADGRLEHTFKGHAAEVLSVAFSNDSRQVLTGSLDATAKLWDTERRKRVPAEIVQLPIPTHEIDYAVFSSNPTRCATISTDGFVRVWETVSGRLINVFGPFGDSSPRIALSRDGRKILIGTTDGQLGESLWDISSGAKLAILPTRKSPKRSIALSTDETQILIGGENTTAAVRDTATGASGPILRGHEDWVYEAAYSPDGKYIATGSRDKTAGVWDAKTGEHRFALLGHTGGVMSVVFSRDGRRLLTVSADATAKLWDTNTGREIVTFRGHTAPLRCGLFLPDGSRVVTGSEDGTAKLWDVASGRDLLTLTGHQGSVIAAASSADGRRIYTASEDGSLRIWRSDPDAAPLSRR